MKNLVIALLAGIVYCSCNSHAETPDIRQGRIHVDTPSLQEVQMRHYKTVVTDFVDSVCRTPSFNGCVLVAKDGEIVYENYVGFRNPSVKKDSINPSTPFHLASVSKPFTAMAIMKLQEENKLKIDDPVANYLAGFPLPAVTIKSLLNHRSGIPNYVHYMENLGWNRKKQITNEDVLNFLITNHKKIQIGAANKRFSYSNTNYALLALIVEKVTGQQFPAYMKNNFFEPLGMKDTYVFTMADSSRFLPSYFANGRQYAFDYLDQVYGDKNIYSTPRDMLKWDQALYSGFFTDNTLDAAFCGYSFEKPGINNYGLGWRMFLLKSGKKFIYHNGWWHGNRTAFYRLPDDNVTVIAFSNNDYKRVYALKGLADLFGNYFEQSEHTED